MAEQGTDGSYLLFSDHFMKQLLMPSLEVQKLQPKDSKLFCRGARAAISPFFKKAAEALWASYESAVEKGKESRNQHLPSRQGRSHSSAKP